MVLFFFKQKTAYEMRISDWSSDVCSSDLPAQDLLLVAIGGQQHPQRRHRLVGDVDAQVATVDAVRRGHPQRRRRSEARCVGNEGVSTCRSRWWQHRIKKKHARKTVPDQRHYNTVKTSND